LSSARPQIADYPFTTKYPNLGIVSIDRERSFVLADIPGLVAGAHRGVGLGHDFLKHIERAGILVHLVEPTPIDQSDPVENYRSIRDELRQYKQHLADRPEIVAVSKSELPGAEQTAMRLQPLVEERVLLVSAVTGAGLPELVRRIANLLEKFSPCSL
jgi:GTP-binding protein